MSPDGGFGGSGAQGTPPPGPKCFPFHAVFEKNWSNSSLGPPLENPGSPLHYNLLVFFQKNKGFRCCLCCCGVLTMLILCCTVLPVIIVYLTRGNNPYIQYKPRRIRQWGFQQCSRGNNPVFCQKFPKFLVEAHLLIFQLKKLGKGKKTCDYFLRFFKIHEKITERESRVCWPGDHTLTPQRSCAKKKIT